MSEVKRGVMPPVEGLWIALDDDRAVFVGRHAAKPDTGDRYFEFINHAVATRIHLSGSAVAAMVDLLTRLPVEPVKAYQTRVVNNFSAAVAHWEIIATPEIAE